MRRTPLNIAKQEMMSARLNYAREVDARYELKVRKIMEMKKRRSRMTNQEAIEYECKNCRNNDGEHNPFDTCNNCHNGSEYVRLEECKELMTDINGDTVYAVRMSDIRQLSSDKQEPQTGHWINYDCDEDKYDKIKCSECGHSFIVDSYHWCDIGFTKDDLKYCPNCGAKMESEDKG